MIDTYQTFRQLRLTHESYRRSGNASQVIVKANTAARLGVAQFLARNMWEDRRVDVFDRTKSVVQIGEIEFSALRAALLSNPDRRVSESVKLVRFPTKVLVRPITQPALDGMLGSWSDHFLEVIDSTTGNCRTAKDRLRDHEARRLASILAACFLLTDSRTLAGRFAPQVTSLAVNALGPP